MELALMGGDLEDPIGSTVAFPGSRDDEDDSDEPDDGFPSEDDLVGRALGQYQLGEVIGRGSMGRVYRAEHMGLDRPCAIKVMNPGLVAKRPEIRERFWAEARAVANLLHPHVVTVHNLGSDRGYHFIEMEFIPGGVTLSQELIRRGAFEPIRATRLTREVVLALGAAHRSGLVHRDVKPSNVLLTAEGRAKLADFGLVRRVSELGAAGVPVAGTPTFMAPELFAGAAGGARSDFYAVGVMYYYLLSARLPFVSEQLGSLIRLHREGSVPDVRDVAPATPDAVAAIISRCLAKRPADRPDDAEALAESLEMVIAQLRDWDTLIRESLEGLDCFVQGGRDNYRLVFPLPGDRLQEVYLELHRGRHNERLLSVFSVCAPAMPEHHEFALRLNAELSLGALSIREVNGQPMYVMTRTYARDRVQPAEIRAALREIARRGDWVEQQLTQVDVN